MAALGYLITEDGFGIDFAAWRIDGPPQLIQVCTDLTDPETQAREFRAISAALRENPDMDALLLTQSSTGIHQARKNAPERTVILPAWEWMLQP